ncbi:hypothetical protein T07_12518 [Trichinella nelsoni]|uniref:Uncharacterized protein n=1 Tax=Trichinella nelsoni TaxID=6336 RepID=A0A0V0RJ77_9BILA|nr:hypothetical protein T07_12518 [Trichinella nelsoni]
MVEKHSYHSVKKIKISTNIIANGFLSSFHFISIFFFTLAELLVFQLCLELPNDCSAAAVCPAQTMLMDTFHN